MLSGKEIFLRLFLSVIFGGLVGLEREVHRREAGLRTHVLVCLGSTLIMLTSLYVFDIYKDKAVLDPVRIAAGVVTGIGFLGAGAIIRYGDTVKGLTTAASLWVLAGVGLSLGCGFYSAAVFTVGLVLIVLLFFRTLEGRIIKKERTKK